MRYFFVGLFAFCLSLTSQIEAGHNADAIVYFYTSRDGHTESIYETQQNGKQKFAPMVCIKNFVLPINSIRFEFEFDPSIMQLTGEHTFLNQYGFNKRTYGSKSMEVTGNAIMPNSGIMCFTPDYFQPLIDVTGVPHTLSIKSAIVTSINPPSEDVIKSSAVFLYNGATLEDIPNSQDDQTPTTPNYNYIDPIPGDLDMDGDVDIADFLIFTDNFGKVGPIPTPLSERQSVRTVTVTVRDTIEKIVTITDPQMFPRPNISLTPGGWHLPTSQMQQILEDVRDVFADRLVYPIDSNISVEYNEQGPLVKANRASDGSYIVWLAPFSPGQTIYQFAHEYGHILSGYVMNPPHIKQLWLEESLAVLASLFALKTLSVDPRYQSSGLDFYYQLTVRDVSLPQNLSQWYQANKSQLEQNGRLWDKNTIVALSLLDIFELYPDDAWNAVKYKDRGTIYYDADFNVYMNEWHRRTPPQWQFVVREIMNSFGVAQAYKPTVAQQQEHIGHKGVK